MPPDISCRRVHGRSRSWRWVVVGLAWLGVGLHADAAEPPSGDAFQIWYYKTDDGKRATLFSAQDLTGFVNQARCQCDQQISTRVLLAPSTTGAYDQAVRVEAYVGNRCDQAMGTNALADPCVRVATGTPASFVSEVNFAFSPIWLAGGRDRNGPQSVSTARPLGTCDEGQGDAGVWVCVEDGMVTDCQSEEFVVKGTQNENSGDMPVALRYDFEPPRNLPAPDSFELSPGDGAMLIEWAGIPAGDVAGFRILCADEDDNALPGRGLTPPALTAINTGNLYFTKNNLCPDGPFGSTVEGDTDGDGTGGESSGTDGGGESAGSSGALDGATTGTKGDTETGGDTDTGTGGTDTGTAGTDTDGPTPLPDAGIESLGWPYVCSGHISGTSRSHRVSGLENERDYRFLVVAYDTAGNPVAASKVLTGMPKETVDFWEACSEAEGEVCGKGGFCGCSSGNPGTDTLLGLGLFVLGLLGRRRRARV